jgi:hypothetical protein
MRHDHGNAEEPSISGKSRPSMAGQQMMTWRFAIVGVSLFLLTLWMAGWFAAASNTLFVSGCLISDRLGSRIAAGASRLRAVPIALGTSRAYLLLFFCADWIMGRERRSGGLPLSWFAFSGAVYVYLCLRVCTRINPLRRLGLCHEPA